MLMFLPFVDYKSIRCKTANETSYKMGESKGSERVKNLNISTKFLFIF